MRADFHTLVPHIQRYLRSGVIHGGQVCQTTPMHEWRNLLFFSKTASVLVESKQDTTKVDN